MKDHSNVFDLRPRANVQAVVCGDRYRFTVLTSRLIRMEYDETGAFEDNATAFAFCREFPVPEFSVRTVRGKLVIETEDLLLEYDGKPFGEGLTVLVKRMTRHKCARWQYGMETLTTFGRKTNLGGTARTLDRADGRIPLNDGIADVNGFTVIDDSSSLLLGKDGRFLPRDHEETDIYFFGYLWAFQEELRDYYRLTGPCPMIPRFALGNWWSRYYRYTEGSYLELMNEFRKRQIPLSVAVIDMDWHLSKADPKYGSTWTGYTWDRTLFPDPKRFLTALKDLGLKSTLNLHPADGVRAFEDAYPAFADYMGVDRENEEPVQFDAADPKQFRGLFETVLRPLEEEGVDFWWLDWQQAGGTSDRRFDPLFMLNHYFYQENARKGRYPLTFSRYAGPGSHRYPIGFSGDTFMTWASLDFQPEFTATASNVGYGWWSHDIGGHMKGVWDPELQVRWLQFGVFSPILRLHSAKNTFILKEPWNFEPQVEAIFTDYLRLRHRLVPYLYTMNEKNHSEGVPLIRPLYYDFRMKTGFGEDSIFYRFRNEYAFGSELLVSPVTSPSERSTGKGAVLTWIPDGDWFDFFTGRHYLGEKELMLYRSLREYPVLAKAGAIVPLAEETGSFGTPLPEALELKLFAGRDGAFRLYEDNESLTDLQKCTTEYRMTWGPETVIAVEPAEGDVSIIPENRAYRITFAGIEKPESITVTAGNEAFAPETSYDAERGILSLSLPAIPVRERIEIRIVHSGKIFERDWKKEILSLLPRWQTENPLKQKIQNALTFASSKGGFLGQVISFTEDRAILGEIAEILTADEA